MVMKEYSTDGLSLDDLLRDVKTHAGQLHFILNVLKKRGAEANGYSIIRSYSNIMEAIANYAIVSPDGDEPYLYKDGSLVVAGTRDEAELLVKSCAPTVVKIKKLGNGPPSTEQGTFFDTLAVNKET